MNYYNYNDNEDWEDVGGYDTDENYKEDNHEPYDIEGVTSGKGQTIQRRVQVTFNKDPSTRQIYYVNCLSGLKVCKYYYDEDQDKVYPKYENITDNDQDSNEWQEP